MNNKSDSDFGQIKITQTYVTQNFMLNFSKINISKYVTQNNVKTQINHISISFKKQPNWLKVLELSLAIIMGLFGVDSFFQDESPINQIEISKNLNYDTIPVWVSVNGPQEITHFDDGSSISMGVGSSYIIHLPTKDGINFIIPEGLEFSTIIKIEKPYIEFDQKAYTWSDKVYLTIIDPWSNHNSEYVERIGSSNDNGIVISTKSGQTLDYVFEESSPDTGIFLAEIILTGFDSIDANNDGMINDAMGITFGKGPREGLLKTAYADELIVSYKVSPKNTITASVPIRMNIGELYVYSVSESSTTFGVELIDPDLNLNIYKDDFVLVNISSESDSDGINLKLSETRFGAFFENTFEITSDKFDNSKLFAVSGDIITAKYYDNTLPSPYMSGDVLEITGSRMFN